MAIPNNCKWKDMDSIISVLNKISSINSLAHTLFPVGGGHDLVEVEKSFEKGSIELRTPHSVRIVKPKVLEFNYFPTHIDWAYFRLETGGLKPFTPNLDLSLIKEKLTEIEPGRYVEKKYGKKDIWDMIKMVIEYCYLKVQEKFPDISKVHLLYLLKIPFIIKIMLLMMPGTIK